jgi:glutamate synthase (NADPH/NADH) large chain
MIGQVQVLKINKNIPHWKYKMVDLSPILYKEPADESVGLYKKQEQDHGIKKVLDTKLIKNLAFNMSQGKSYSGEYKIKNTDRAVGAMLSNEISKQYGGAGLPEDTIQIRFRGSAGQSFGAFSAKGIKFTLEGESNDYFGKGLSGAKLIVSKDRNAPFDADKNIIIGNVALYGATSGEVYISGMAGERFAVRNSGAKAVVEGIGDHGCEYMTGGIVLVLGETGQNFAAGMSGGIAYIFDPNRSFKQNCNTEMIDFDPLEAADLEIVRTMLRDHFRHTASKKALNVLENWDTQVANWVKVMPRDYKAVLLKRQIKMAETPALV